MTKVSIIIPLYNKEKYIENTLNLLLQQSYTDYEIIIVDDGSTDSSGQIIEKYRDFENVTIIHKPNGGVSSARNKGLDAATGEWIQFLDADDVLNNDFFPKAIPLLDAVNPDILFSDFIMIDEQGNEIKRIESELNQSATPAELCKIFTELQYKNGFFGFISNKLIRRKVIEKGRVRFDESIKLAEDLDFYARVYPNVKSVLFSDLSSFYYLQTDENYINDDSIDYSSQITVNLNIKRWFVKLNQYETYSEILDRRIAQYVFLTLFHSSGDPKQMEKYYHEIIRCDEVMDTIDYHLFSGLERKILKTVSQRNFRRIKHIFLWRNYLRGIYRKVK